MISVNISTTDIERTAPKWYVLRVKSRHEFITNGELEKKGIKTYLPSVKKLRQWKDRKKLLEFSLFPGYLFVNICPTSQDHLKVLKTRGAVAFISLALGYPAPVPCEEMNSLQLLTESGQELNVYPNLKEGVRVRVVRGSLHGAEGVLLKKEALCIFSINIELLGRSISVKVPADDIECA